MKRIKTPAYRRPYVLIIGMLLLGCQKQVNAQVIATKFAATAIAKEILPGVVDEASGIADSKINPGYLWIEQDSGNPNDLFLMDREGRIEKKINIKPATNRDWEDIAVGNGPVKGTSYIYLADIGDNKRLHKEYFIYRFPEPAAAVDTVFIADKLSFKYPDGSHDAEAILVDPKTSDIYIITKRDAVSLIFKFPYPQNTTGLNTVVYVGSLAYNGVVSAACSADGQEIIIKTYLSLNYWKRKKTESIEQALKRKPVQLKYLPEPQGEAVCFRNDRSGFYTLSERPASFAAVSLNFYKRE